MLDLTSFPIIDVEAGGSLQQVLEALNYLISLAVPSLSSGGGTSVIPGHGRIADYAEVVYYRDMVSVIHDRIQDMIRKEMTLEQIIAAGPTRGYDSLYGQDTGAWTTEMFVEAAYESFTR